MRSFGEDSGGGYEGLLMPQKTIKPVASSLLAPSVASPAGSTWQDFAGTYGDMGGIGALSGVHNSKLFNTMTNQIAQAIGFTGNRSTPGTYQFENANEGGTFTDTAQGVQASPEFLQALENYRFAQSPTEQFKGAITDTAGQSVGSFTTGNKDTGFDKFANVAVPMALAAIGGELASGLFSGAGAGAASAATPISAAEQISFMAANGMTDAAIAAAAPELAAAGGLTGVGGAGLLGGLPAITTNPATAIESYLASNPVTMPELMAGIPEVSSIPVMSAVPAATGNGAFLGEGVKSGIPAWDNAGTMLGSLGNTASSAVSWLKDNPTLGRLLLGGATSLLSQSGSGSSGSTAPAKAGPAVQWTSPMQQGLLSPVQQYAPPAIQQNQPAGLLAQGYANDGAWRYLKG